MKTNPTPPTKEQTIDKLLDAVMVAYDENTPNEALRPVFEEHLSQAILQERNRIVEKLELIIDVDFTKELAKNIEIYNGDGSTECKLCGTDPIRQREFLLKALENNERK